MEKENNRRGLKSEVEYFHNSKSSMNNIRTKLYYINTSNKGKNKNYRMSVMNYKQSPLQKREISTRYAKESKEVSGILNV